MADNIQQSRILAYKNATAGALEAAAGTLAQVQMINRPNIETSIKINKTRKAVKALYSYQDKRLLRAWQSEARKVFKRAVFLSGKNKREGRKIYAAQDLVGQNGPSDIARLNKDAAKAYLVRLVTRPILLEMGEELTNFWSSAGFSKMMGYKKKRRGKYRKSKKGRRYRKMRKMRRGGRRLRYRLKKRRSMRRNRRRNVRKMRSRRSRRYRR